MNKVKKITNIIELAKLRIEKGSYVISEHAQIRQKERYLSLGDII